MAEIINAGSHMKAEVRDALARTSSPATHDDHFIERNGVRCAGSHLLIDLYDAHHLDDIVHIEGALKQAVDVAGATLLHIHLHHFEPNGGVSGVAVLAESHISIHTWPENGYAALDVFMCGKANPLACLPVFRDAFEPECVNVIDLLRGEGTYETPRQMQSWRQLSASRVSP